MLSLSSIFNRYPDLKIENVLHIGSHECQELENYNKFGIKQENIQWIEANPLIIDRIKKSHRGKNLKIVKSVISENDGLTTLHIVSFNKRSSLLLLKNHLVEHPNILQVYDLVVRSRRIETLIKENEIAIKEKTFLNINIQGIELSILKSFGDFDNLATKNLFQNIEAIYIEKNFKELYEDCANIYEIDNYLKKYGFHRVDIVMTQGNDGAFYIKQKE